MMRRSILYIAVAVAVATGSTALQSTATAAYAGMASSGCRVIDAGLGSIAGTDGAGNFVGTFFGDDLQVHAAVWGVDGQRRDLGALSDSPAVVSGMNRDRTVVGFIPSADFTTTHAFTLQDGVLASLPEPGGFTGSAATGIDDEGDIVGYLLQQDVSHAALWPAGDAASVRLLDEGTAVSSRANGIDDEGHVVGSMFSEATDPDQSGAVWGLDGSLSRVTPAGGLTAVSHGVAVGLSQGNPIRMRVNGAIQILEKGESFATPDGVNRRGVAVGEQSPASTVGNTTAAMWQGVQETILPSPFLDSPFTAALAIDDLGAIGGAFVGSDGMVHAALWTCP